MDKNSFIDKLESKYGKYALDGLMYYVAGLMITVFILNQTGHLPYSMLYLDGSLIMKGELWRLVTFLLIPISHQPFFLFFELLIIIMCANGIEAVIGSFRLTLYYLLGAFLMIVGSLFDPHVQLDSNLMYLSLFFGYSTLYPNEEMLFMFIIPIKIKYLAYLSGFGLILTLITSPWSTKIALLLSFANYFIFFVIPALKGIKYERKQYKRKMAFENAVSPQKDYRHKCSVCGKTDVSNPEILFKYCVCKECGENGVCFCPEHLELHKNK